MYIGVADIIDIHDIIIKPIQKYTYTNVYDAEGRNPYEVDDYKPVESDIKISGKHIIVNLRKYDFVLSVLLSRSHQVLNINYPNLLKRMIEKQWILLNFYGMEIYLQH